MVSLVILVLVMMMFRILGEYWYQWPRGPRKSWSQQFFFPCWETLEDAAAFLAYFPFKGHLGSISRVEFVIYNLQIPWRIHGTGKFTYTWMVENFTVNGQLFWEFRKNPALFLSGFFGGWTFRSKLARSRHSLTKITGRTLEMFSPSPCAYVTDNGFLGMEASGNLPQSNFHELPAKLLAHLGKFQGAPCIRGRHVSWMQDIQVFSQGSFRCRTNDATTKNRFRVFFGAEKLQPADRSSVLRWGGVHQTGRAPFGSNGKNPFFQTTLIICSTKIVRLMEKVRPTSWYGRLSHHLQGMSVVLKLGL